MQHAEQCLSELRALGVQLSVQAGELRVQAPRGVLTPAHQQALREHKQALIALLQPPLDLSLFFFGTASGAGQDPYRLLLDAARLADQLGLCGIWTPERHFDDLGGLFPNPALVAAALSQTTRHLRLRAGSVVLPLQDPLRVAEEWAVVDQLSGGRVELSFASGWHARDFVLNPGSYAQRHALLYDRLAQVQALWRGEALARPDGAGGQIAVQTFPRPQQPELPVWLTAIGNPEAYRRIGASGAHLLTALLDQSIEELHTKLQLYRQALADHGYDPASRKVAVFVHTFVGEDRARVKAQVRAPLRAYLRSTLHLIGQLTRQLELGLDPSQLSAADQDALLDFAFERYFEERALLGDAASCRARLEQLRAAGVQEVACLVDFGLDHATVLAGIERLAALNTHD
ncbi:MAG: MupA/Atu3671 family FMN-dependent luciferase-like monooxygenase [Candidatus Sericytochromatia bacterium]